MSIHGTEGIRKQKFIGTRKHNSEVEKMGDKHVTTESDGSTKGVAVKNIHGTTLHITNDDMDGDDTKGKRRGEMNGDVAPRSYRDVLVNGKTRQMMT